MALTKAEMSEYLFDKLGLSKVELDRYLNEHGVQGSALERPWIPPTE